MFYLLILEVDIRGTRIFFDLHSDIGDQMNDEHEIGGYFELERFSGSTYHDNAIALNCGRGCLAYLVELRRIKRIWIPDYICGSVSSLLLREGVEVLTYSIGPNMLPDSNSFSVSEDEWMLLMDYYGQLRKEDVDKALDISKGKLIVDETQGFFRYPWQGADTFYTCRKWFGVADGAYLVTADGTQLARELTRDESFDRMGFLLGRLERTASDFFDESTKNNEFFASEPARSMSLVTENLLRAVNYDEVKTKRDANWDILDNAFSDINKLSLHKPNGAFMYPLMVEDAQKIRRELIKKKIYVPCLWPDVLNFSDKESIANHFAQDILPLPLDQRYGSLEMLRVINEFKEISRKGI